MIPSVYISTGIWYRLSAACQSVGARLCKMYSWDHHRSPNDSPSPINGKCRLKQRIAQPAFLSACNCETHVSTALNATGFDEFVPPLIPVGVRIKIKLKDRVRI
jgi:hypothetical protein